MSLVTAPLPALARAPDSPKLAWRRIRRIAMTVAGSLLIAVGAVGAVLPGHLGVPVLVVGLILVLRSSYFARRTFIRLQRRHPKWFFPLRRLLRRNPEVAPVAYQQLLRMERAVVPRKHRMAKVTRRKLAGRPQARA